MVFLGNPESGVELHPIDFAAFAHPCGGIGLTVEDPAECASVVEQFLGAPDRAILQVGGRSTRASASEQGHGRPGVALWRVARPGRASSR
jgi:thiamine pyrophosphate-dependent acetolactate synthase large subunit-like protein